MMMMRKTSLVLLGAAAGAAMTLFATEPQIFSLTGAIAAVAETYHQLDLFGGVFEMVRADYVDVPDDAKLVESAINGMLSGLDPHSSYMDAKSFRDMRVEAHGEFGGVGLEVTMENGLLKVVAPIDGARRQGRYPSQRHHHQDRRRSGAGNTVDQAIEKMRGSVHTKVTLTIRRKGQDKAIEVSLMRDIIRVRSVRSEVEGDDVGYIRVTQFNEQTTEGLKKAITDVRSKTQ
jgi:carboxyl-terminal processing protease